MKSLLKKILFKWLAKYFFGGKTHYKYFKPKKKKSLKHKFFKKIFD